MRDVWAEMRVSGVVASGAVRATGRTRAVAALFDLPMEKGEAGDARAGRTLFAPFTFVLGAGTVTLITGPSGSGKTTLLRALERGLAERGGIRVLRLDEIGLPGDRAVVDCFGGRLEEALGHLGRAGLSEAHILVRAPAELSDGQRFRYRLAQFFASPAEVLLADEFAATLDRVTAKVVAHQLRKFISASAGGAAKSAIVATTHEDIVEDLAADCVLYKGLGEGVEIVN